MTSVTVARRADELVRRCYTGLDSVSLRAEVLRRLRQLVPVDAAFFATVDPATLLFTSVLVEEPLGSSTALFLDNEFGADDVNKFTVLAGAHDPVRSLDWATEGERRISPRYAEIMRPLRLGDELRAALMSKGRCWGVMCLHREDAPSGFTPAELDVVRRVVPHIGEGLRRALLVDAQSGPMASDSGPGVVVLNEDFSVSSMNPQAEQWLEQLGDGGNSETELPHSVYAAARALQTGSTPARRPWSTVRLRTARGDWLTLYASPMKGRDGPRTSIVLEPARPVELAPLVLEAHGLTPAQIRVATLVLRGRSTRQIVNELQISPHTVQEHLGVVFDRFGIGSRRELVSALLGGQH